MAAHKAPLSLVFSRQEYWSGLPFPSTMYECKPSCFSCVWLFATLWTAAYQTSLSIINSWSLLKLKSIELVMPSNYIILCCLLLLLSSNSPASGSFQMSQLFTSGGQRIGVSASKSVLPMNIKDWVPLGRTGWISLQSKGLSTVFSKGSILQCLAFFMIQFSHPYMTTGKTLTRWTFVNKVMSLLFNMLSRFIITFLPRSKHLNFMAAITICSDFAPKIKSATVSTVSPCICHEVMGLDAMIFVFWMLSFKPTFSLCSFTFIKRLFSSSLISATRVVSSACLSLLMFLLANACAVESKNYSLFFQRAWMWREEKKAGARTGCRVEKWCFIFL